MQQLRLYLAARSPGAIPVIGLTAMALNPGIEQNIARAAIETLDRLVHFQQAQIAEPADIQYCARTILCAEQAFMKGWYQRGSLASSRQVASPKIAYHADAGQLGE